MTQDLVIMLGLVARARAGARGLATLGRVAESMVVVQAGRAAPHQGAVELLPSLEMFQPAKYGLPDWGEGETSTEE